MRTRTHIVVTDVASESSLKRVQRAVGRRLPGRSWDDQVCFCAKPEDAEAEQAALALAGFKSTSWPPD